MYPGFAIAGVVVFIAGIVLGWCLLRFFQFENDYCYVDCETIEESQEIIQLLKLHQYFARIANQAFYLFPPLPDPVDPQPAPCSPILLSTNLTDYSPNAPKFFIGEVSNDPVTGEGGALVIAFRGTWDMADIETDISLASGDILDQISQVQWLMAHERIDEYSKDALNSIWLSHIYPAVVAGRRVELVGYSLGAAIAVYILSHIADTLGILGESSKLCLFRCFLYGCPYVVPRMAAQTLAPYIFAVANHRDIVCRAPKAMFSSIGTLTGPGNKILYMKPCSDEGESTDVKFINSMELLHIAGHLNFGDHRLTRYLAAFDSALAHHHSLVSVLLLDDEVRRGVALTENVGDTELLRDVGHHISRGDSSNTRDGDALLGSIAEANADGAEEETDQRPADGESHGLKVHIGLATNVVANTVQHKGY